MRTARALSSTPDFGIARTGGDRDRVDWTVRCGHSRLGWNFLANIPCYRLRRRKHVLRLAKAMVALESRIVRDRKVCAGVPVFKGTRIPVQIVLASLADGDSSSEILASYPSLSEEDIKAAISFAAWAGF